MPPQQFLIFLLHLSGGSYTEEPPVKLLTVQSVATRFPAADSEYRDSVENGYVSVESFGFADIVLYSRMRMQAVLRVRVSMIFLK